MRITDMLSTNDTVSKVKYKQLRKRPVKIVFCGTEDWNFRDEENTTEAEARIWIRANRQIAAFEEKHGIDRTASVLSFRPVREQGEAKPEWPDELKPYRSKTDNILEAYFCHKFGIE